MSALRINRNSKYLRFIRWFERAGYRDEESGWRGFEYGYRLGYEAAKKRAVSARGES